MNEILQSMTDVYEMSHLYRHFIICFVLFLITAGFCILDLISGVRTAKARHQKLHSHRYRKTIEKMTWYWTFQLLGFLFGLIGTVFDWYDWPYISIIIALAIGLIEGKSMLEHAKRRKCNAAKIPETIHEIVDWVGEDEAKKVLTALFNKKGLIADE